MRARNIKPGFFKNEEIGDLKYEERLFFIGLWCLADREGFFEKRPKKMAVEIFPYDRSVDEEKIEKMLQNLMSRNLITCNGMYGHVTHFSEHQRPHPHEAKSKIPDEIKKTLNNQCHEMSLHVTKCKSDIRNIDIRNTDITEKPKFILFGEFQNVKLREGEYEKLKSRCDENILKDKIESLSGGIKSKGYKYKDHYATLLTWLRKDNVLADIQKPVKTRLTCPHCSQEMNVNELKNGNCPVCEGRINE